VGTLPFGYTNVAVGDVVLNCWVTETKVALWRVRAVQIRNIRFKYTPVKQHAANYSLQCPLMSREKKTNPPHQSFN